MSTEQQTPSNQTETYTLKSGQEIGQRSIDKLSDSERLVLLAAQEAMLKAATTDELTGLGDRQAFMDVFEPAVNKAHDRGESMLLLFADGDRLKEVNDTAGHTAGDTMLKTIASILTETIRESDQAYRIGGDEFVAILPGFNYDKDNDAKTLQAFQDRIEELSKKKLAGLEVPGVGISLGAVLLKPGESAKEFLERGDKSMYERKKLKGQSRSTRESIESPRQKIIQDLSK